MLKVWFSKKSVRLKYLISYSTIALVSAMVLVLVCSYMYTNARNNVLKTNELVLKSVKKDVDSLFQDMNNMYRNISANQKLLSMKDLQPGSVDYSYRVFEFRGEQVNLYPELAYYIFIRNGNSIITGHTTMDYEKYYENFIAGSFDYGSAEIWYNDFFSSGGNRFYRGESYDALGTPSRFISFVQPIPFSRVVSPDMSLVISVEENAFIGIYKEEFGFQNQDIFIINRKGEYLINTDELNLTDTIVKEALPEITTKYADNSVYMYVLSQNEDYIYVVKSDNSVFWKALNPVVGFTIVSFITFVIIIFILVRFLLRVTYNPIKELIALSNDSIQKKIPQGSDELSVIKNSILSVSEKLVNNESEIKLRSFLIGKTILGSIEEIFQNGVDFSNSRYFTVLFKAGDLSLLFAEWDTADVLKKENADFIISNVLGELLTDTFKFVKMTKTDEASVAIIVTNNVNYKASFEFAVNKAKQFINQHFGFDFFVAVSNVYDEAKDFSRAYSEAVFALENNLLIGKDKIIYFEYLMQKAISENSGYYFSIDFETELKKALHDENCIYAKELIEQFFNINFNSENTNINISRLALCDLMATLLKSVQENRISYSETLELVENCMHKVIRNVVNMDELKKNILTIVDTICQSGGFHTVKHINDIISIVEQEYANQDLGNDVIAFRLGISEQHMSTIFKKHMDINLHEYIQNKRIDKAKELILQFNMTNEEIANRVGFGSVRNFLRTFKKQIGDTPASYRTKLRELGRNEE